MHKVVWTCWFQGRERAPELVQRCLASWEDKNPGWRVRCLDARNVRRYAPLLEQIDLGRQFITAASLSDLVRLALLHEYGGVWADATLFCNKPLDEWLGEPLSAGFFAFANPAPDRTLATWFLAAAPGNALAAKWTARAFDYWRGRTLSLDYFWASHEFRDLCAEDDEARRDWNTVPKISADGPHAIQTAGMFSPAAEARSKIDWTTPVFKLSHRDQGAFTPGSLVYELLEQTPLPAAVLPDAAARAVGEIASLKVGTENLGDHIQIIAGQEALARLGYETGSLIDRDDEIASAPSNQTGNTGILLNGWFKSNPEQWPPHPRLTPVYFSFHARPFQAPSLTGPAAIEHYRKFGPVGARDRYTENLLRAHGVDAYLSHCLSLVLPRRLPRPDTQTETYVVSRDRRVLDQLPSHIQDAHFISHYTGTADFAENLQRARNLLDLYRDRAKLIVTTMLHCALPAIAMGIPVVAFYPPNDGAQHASDRERFSSLAELIRVFELSEAGEVDWAGYRADVSRIKLHLIEKLAEMCAASWGPGEPAPLAPIASSALLPVPSRDEIDLVMNARTTPGLGSISRRVSQTRREADGAARENTHMHYYSWPTPHIFLSQLIAPEHYARLRFPDIEPAAMGRIGRDIYYGEAQWDQVMSDPHWRSFASEFMGEAMLRRLMRIFAADIRANGCVIDPDKVYLAQRAETRVETESTPLSLDADPHALFFRFDFQAIGAEYDKKVHCDHLRRVLGGVLFMTSAEDEGMEGGEFALYSDLEFNNDRRCHRPQVEKTFKFQHNQGVVFLNSNRGFHGPLPIQRITGMRKWIYFSVSSQRDIWQRAPLRAA